MTPIPPDRTFVKLVDLPPGERALEMLDVMPHLLVFCHSGTTYLITIHDFLTPIVSQPRLVDFHDAPERMQ